MMEGWSLVRLRGCSQLARGGRKICRVQLTCSFRFGSVQKVLLILYSANFRKHLILIQVLIITAFDELKDLVWDLGKEMGLELCDPCELGSGACMTLRQAAVLGLVGGDPRDLDPPPKECSEPLFGTEHRTHTPDLLFQGWPSLLGEMLPLSGWLDAERMEGRHGDYTWPRDWEEGMLRLVKQSRGQRGSLERSFWWVTG